MSKVAIGNGFRDQIHNLIKLAGWRPDTERRVGEKKADVYFQRRWSGRNIRLAVEAKNYSGPLGQSEVEPIIGGYALAHQNNDIDLLWIVAPEPLKGAKDFIDQLRWVQFFTLEALLGALMDFSRYLNDIVFDHESKGLDHYYISPTARHEGQSEADFDLVAFLEEWLTSSDRRPIAIVEGYGTGKTSIAAHFTNRLATKFLNNSGQCRIPIYVELGRLTTQQSLTGLFSALFTSDHLVEGFSYPLFRRMNQMGCFLIILDGFDEMKHLMTPMDFTYNFKALNELVEGEAKVLLLGRPSAFSSGEERQYLLHGRSSIDGIETTDPSAPNYVELRLRPFDKAQVMTFVERFLKFRASRPAAGAPAISDQLIEDRLKEIAQHDYGDLLERPVQAKMLAELAILHGKPLGNLTRFTLYKRFMDELITREASKKARQSFGTEERRQFMQQLCWWMWQSNHTLGVRLQDIPDELFAHYHVDGYQRDAIRRDLVSGSFLEEKGGDLFIVPHRSFIEFIVAEYLVRESELGLLDKEFLRTSWQLFKPDVLSFFLESSSIAALSGLADALIVYHGSLSGAWLQQVASSKAFVEVIRARAVSSWSPWHIAIVSKAIQADAGSPIGRELAEVIQEVRNYLDIHRGEPQALAAAMLAVLPFSIEDDSRLDAAKILCGFMLEFGAVGRLTVTVNGKGKPDPLVIDIGDMEGKLIDAFRRSISPDTTQGSLLVHVDLASLAARVGNLLYPRYALADSIQSTFTTQTVSNPSWPIANLSDKVTILYNDLRLESIEKNWDIVSRYLRMRPTVTTATTKQ